MKIILPISGFNIDVWLVHLWLENYLNTNSNLEPVLFYDSASYEILSYWPFEKVESTNLLHLYNYRQEDSFLFDDIRMDYLRLLSYKYFGSCLVSDVRCILNKKILHEHLPYTKFGLVAKKSLLKNKDKEWYNIIHTDFDEFNFVQDVFTQTVIISQDYSDDYIKLYDKYHTFFYDMRYHPNLHKAIFSLLHKQKNGTFISCDWCKEYDLQNKDTIFSYYYNDDYRHILLEKKLNKMSVTL